MTAPLAMPRLTEPPLAETSVAPPCLITKTRLTQHLTEPEPDRTGLLAPGVSAQALPGLASWCWQHEQSLIRLDDWLDPYLALVQQLQQAGLQKLWLEEPILAQSLDFSDQARIERCYHRLANLGLELYLRPMHGPLGLNLRFSCQLPITGLELQLSEHLAELSAIADWLPAHKPLRLQGTPPNTAECDPRLALVALKRGSRLIWLSGHVTSG